MLPAVEKLSVSPMTAAEIHHHQGVAWLSDGAISASIVALTHTHKDCKSFDKMIRDATVGKPKDRWKPPSGYKSALSKALDAQNDNNNKDKKKTHAVMQEEDTDGDSDLS